MRRKSSWLSNLAAAAILVVVAVLAIYGGIGVATSILGVVLP